MLWFIQLLWCSFYFMYNLAECKEFGATKNLLTYGDITGKFLTYNEFGYKSKSSKPTKREWISHSSATFLMWNLANNQSWTDILKKIDIVVTPNSNPDGYEYTWKEERLWRKNRKSVSSESDCVGVDLNRNFPFKWKFEVEMRNENDRWWKDNFSDFCR